MTGWLVGVAAFALLWTLQYALTLRQARHYFEVVRELRQLGIVSSALVRGRLGPGAVAVVAADRVGRIVAARQMRGVSVFARFRNVPALVGTDAAALARGGVRVPRGVSERAFREAAGNLLKSADLQGDSGSSSGWQPES